MFGLMGRRLRRGLALFLALATSLDPRVIYAGPGATFTADGLRVNFTTNAETARLQTVDGAELVQPAQWAMSTGGGTAAAANNAGVLTLTGDGTFAGQADQAFPTITGRSYTLSYGVATNTAGRQIGTTKGGTDVVAFAGKAAAGAPYSETFVATGPLTWVRFLRSGAGATTVSGITLREAVPFAGFANGPDGVRDLWDASRVGVRSDSDNTVSVNGRSLTATKNTTDARVILTLYTRPGAMYRVIYTADAATSYSVRDAGGVGATYVSGTTTPAQTAFTFVASAGIHTLLWTHFAAPGFTISNIRIEEVSATAPVGAAPANVLPANVTGGTDGWTAQQGATLSNPDSRTLRVTAIGDGGSTGRAVRPMTTVIGKVYRLWGKLATVAGAASAATVGVSNTVDGTGAYASTSASEGSLFSVEFKATATTTYLLMLAGADDPAQYADWTDLEIREVGHVANGDFANGTTGWTPLNGAGLSVASGELVITADGVTAYPLARQSPLTTVVGRTYLMRGTLRRGTTTRNVYMQAQRTDTGASLGTSAVVATNVATAVAFYFTAVTTSTRIDLVIEGAPAAGETAIFDNITVEEVAEQGQGALVVEFMLPAVSATQGMDVLWLSDGTINNGLSVQVQPGGSIRFEGFIAGVSTGATTFGAAGTVVAGQRVRVAIAWSLNRIAASVNGAAVVTDASAQIAQVHRLDLMGRPTNTRPGDGFVRELKLLTSAQNDNWLPLASALAA